MAEIPKEMWAAQFNKPYKIHQVPVQQKLDEYDLLIKVAVASFCHTDMLILEGQMTSTPSKLSGSHEPTGTVVKVGSAAKDFKVGDRIAALGWRNCCYECDMCQQGETWIHYCPNMLGFVGSNLDGAFQEYLTVDSRFSVHLPDQLSFTSAAPLTCAGGTSWRALVVSEAKAGHWLGIVGSGGGLGHIAVQLAVAKGIKVIAVDATDSGIELSKRAGSHHVLDARKGQEAVAEEVKKITGGSMCWTTLALSDAPPAAGLSAIITRVQGTVVQVAQPTRGVTIPFPEIIFRDIRVRGSKLCSRDQLQELVDFVVEHKIKVETIPYTGIMHCNEMVEEAYQSQKRGKYVLVIDEEAAARDDDAPAM